MGLKQFSVEDIETVLGIFLVNDFEINSMVRYLIKDNPSNCQVDEEEEEELRQNSLSGLYPLGCILSHHCLANTVHTFENIEVHSIIIFSLKIYHDAMHH